MNQLTKEELMEEFGTFTVETEKSFKNLALI